MEAEVISLVLVNESAVRLLTKGRKARLKYTSEWGKHKSTGETHEVTAQGGKLGGPTV